MNRNAIGIFDSGVGGMTVFSEISKELPNENLIYLGDTKNFPYGDKSKDTIIKISKKCTEFLLTNKVKMIVVACGTATSQALEILQKEYDVPVIGIITPTVMDIKSNKNQNRKIGVIATEGTIRSGQWEKQLKSEINNIEVINKACPLLAQMAEQGWTKNNVAKEAIKEYLKIFEGKDIDTLILGCTHYPLFEDVIRERLGNSVNIINTGKKIAKYLRNYLKENNIENDKENIGKYEIYLTDTECKFIEVAKNISNNINTSNIKKVDIE